MAVPSQTPRSIFEEIDAVQVPAPRSIFDEIDAVQPAATIADEIDAVQPQTGKLADAAKLAARGATSEGFYFGLEGLSRAAASTPRLIGDAIKAYEKFRLTHGYQADKIPDAEKQARLATIEENTRALEQDMGPTLAPVKGYADAVKDTRERIHTALPVADESAASIWGQVAQGIGQAVGTLPTYVIPGFGPAHTAGQLYQQGYEDAKESGANEVAAHDAGIKNVPAAALEYLSDKFIIGRILKPLKGKLTVGQLVKSVLATSATEGATEGAQQGWQNYVASSLAGYDPDRKLDDGVINAALVGALVGGIVGTGGPLLSEGARRLQEKPEPKTDATPEDVEKTPAESTPEPAAAAGGDLDAMLDEAEKQRQAAEAAQQKDQQEREARQAALTEKRSKFDFHLNNAREIAGRADATTAELQGAVTVLRDYMEDNAVGLTLPQRQEAQATLAQIAPRAEQAKAAAEAEADQRVAAARAEQEAKDQAARERIRAEKAALKAQADLDPATGKKRLDAMTDEELAAEAEKGSQAAMRLLMQRSEGESTAGGDEDLLTVLKKVKLPGSDETMGSELTDLRKEWVNFGQAQQLFSGRPGSLDTTAETLRTSYGFDDIQTPADVIEFAKRALNGEKIMPTWRGERVDYGRTDTVQDFPRIPPLPQSWQGPEAMAYRRRLKDYIANLTAWTGTAPDVLPFRSVRDAAQVALVSRNANGGKPWRVTSFRDQQPVGHVEFDSKLEAVRDAALNRQYDPQLNFSRDLEAARPQNEPAEQMAVADFEARLKRIAPGLMLQYRVLVGDPDMLLKLGVRREQLTGTEQAAHFARRKILWFLAQNVRADKDGLLPDRLRRDVLHESAHGWLLSLDSDMQEDLKARWANDVQRDNPAGDGRKAMPAKGGWLDSMRKNRVKLRAGVETDWAEYWAERIAQQNNNWAARRERGAVVNEQHFITQLAYDFRTWLMEALEYLQNAFTRTKRYNLDFRAFLSDERFESLEAPTGQGVPMQTAQQTLELDMPLGVALPNVIRNLTPRWQSKALEFESTLDKALYYAGAEGNTEVRTSVVNSLNEQTGLSAGQIATLARSLREKLRPLAANTASEGTLRVPPQMRTEAAALTGVEFAHAKTLEEIPAEVQDAARQYVLANKTPEAKQADAIADVANLLTLAEEKQGDLFAYAGGLDQSPAPDSRPDDGPTGKVQREAEALKTPYDASKLAAAFGKGDRISSIIPELVKRPSMTWDIRGVTIESPRDLQVFTNMLRTPYVETAKIVMLNSRREVVHSEILSIGALTTTLLSPSNISQVLARAPQSERGYGIIISHNHPSGDPAPSSADVSVTRLMADILKSTKHRLLDHVVTNGDKYYSFAEAGMLGWDDKNLTSKRPQERGADADRKREIGELADWEKVKRSDLAQIKSDTHSAGILSALRQVDPTALHLLYLNRLNFLVGIERVPGFTLAQGNQVIQSLQTRIFTNTGEQGATALILGAPDTMAEREAAALMRDVSVFCKKTDIQLLDFYAAQYLQGHSARKAGVLEQDNQVRKYTQQEQITFAREEQSPEERKAALFRELSELNGQIARLEKKDGPRSRAALRDLLGERSELRSQLDSEFPTWRKEQAQLAAGEATALPDRKTELQRLLKQAEADVRAEKIGAESWAAKYRQDLDREFPGWQGTEQKPPAADTPATDSTEDSPFNDQAPEYASRPDIHNEVEGHSTLRTPWLVRTWEHIRDALHGIRGAIPELPSFADDRTQQFSRLRQFYKLIKRGTPRVWKDASDQLGEIVQPLLKAGTMDANSYARLQKLQARVRQLREDNRPIPAPMEQEIAALNRKLEREPYGLFQKIAFYMDLKWRVETLKDEQGNPIAQPLGMNAREINERLNQLKQILASSPHRALVLRALQQHQATVKAVAADLRARDLSMPKDLENPFYFPHIVLEQGWDALERVKLDTQEDFRAYLMKPVGSTRPIETDYAKAMYYHLVAVGSHNLRSDLTQDYLKPYDVMTEVRERAKELAEKYGRPVSWREAFHTDYAKRGFVLFHPDDKLPMHPEMAISRDALARRIGVALTDAPLQQQLQKLAREGITIMPGDLTEALAAGERETWVLPEKVSEALNGMLRRESRTTDSLISKPIALAQGLWKRNILFAPWNYPRYEYNNTVADLEKLFSADPEVFRLLPAAAREVRQFIEEGKGGRDVHEAFKLGVLDSVTASELNDLTALRQFEALKTRGDDLRDLARRASTLFLAGNRSTLQISKLREATFRYAKFKADLDRLRNGARPIYAGAYWRDIDAIQDSRKGANDANYHKAAEISLATFGDYNNISVLGQEMRRYLIPFYSWLEINFRYHANLFRNLKDMTLAGDLAAADAAKAGARATAALGATFSRKAAGSLLLRLALPYAAVALWNGTGERKELEETLSDEDRRRFHIILGKDDDGKTRVIYAATALADVMKWFGGPDAARLAGDLASGRTNFSTALSDWMQRFPRDFANNVFQVGPAVKIAYTALSKKSTFPDVTDQRSIPAYDLKWAILGQATDQFTADLIRRAVDKDYMAPRDAKDWTQQIILQVRKRDPQQWAFYEIKDKAAAFLEEKTGRTRSSEFNAPDQQVLRNFRRAIYRADIPNAIKFYDRLVELGYTADRFKSSIRAQDPLSELPKELRGQFVEGLSRFERNQLTRAYEYYARMTENRGAERALFPSERATPSQRQRFQPRHDRLQQEMESAERLTPEQLRQKAEKELRRSLLPAR